MYTATFTFAPGEFDAEFHALDQVIAQVAKSIPGYLGEESWENPTTGLIANVYYWDSLDALQTLMRHPAHQQAKQQQARWLKGYQVVIAQVVGCHGDGGIGHPLENLAINPQPDTPRPSMPAATALTHLDLRYADTSARQVLDLYLPDTPPPPGGYPLIVHIHGGAWRVGDKRDRQMNGPRQLLGQGYALASINYRLSDEARFPAQIHDVKAAIRWLRGNAAAYRIDPQRVAAWGGSAGGHLSALVGTSAGVAELEDLTLGHPQERSDVQAVVSWFGPTDFLKMDVYLRQTGCGTPDHGAPDSPESQLLGAPIAEVPDAVRRANPETWLRPDCPPFLLQHGTRDHLVPYQHSVRLADRIDEVAGAGRARLTLLEGARHGGAAFESAENLVIVAGFLREHLG